MQGAGQPHDPNVLINVLDSINGLTAELLSQRIEFRTALKEVRADNHAMRELLEAPEERAHEQAQPVTYEALKLSIKEDVHEESRVFFSNKANATLRKIRSATPSL